MRPKTIILASALLTAVPLHSRAVDGQTLEIQGTNLVLSWPSPGGYQQYLIEYRPTLDLATPWTELTNNYFANSSTRTTFIIPGVTVQPQPPGGGGGGTNEPPPPPSSATLGQPAEPVVARSDGTGPTLPLALYPPRFDLSEYLIFDPSVSGWISGATYVRPPLPPTVSPGSTDGPLDGPGDNPPVTGFYRVFHIPDWAFNLNDYTYDGPTFFPVDFADYMDRVENIEVLLDGQPMADAAVLMPYVFSTGETNWGMLLYLDLYQSGTHELQLRTTLRLRDAIEEEMTLLVLSNQTGTIDVDNEITFPAWDDLIQTTNFTFHALTKNQTTPWWIDIYDAQGYYVNGASGSTSNGTIEWTWDLTDTLGIPRDDLGYDPFFYSYVTFYTSPGHGTMRTTPAAQVAYPNSGCWVFSYFDRHYLEAGTNYANGQSRLNTAISAMAAGPASRGIPAAIFPLKFGTNIYTQKQRDDSYADPKALYLYNPIYRNFYYHGHANGDYLGCDMHRLDTNGLIASGISLPGSKAYLYSLSISNEITFNRYSGSRPYRFVWLDGCSTATGNWPGTFGVNKATNDYAFYTNSVTNPKHRRPSAFVGWNQTVGGPGWGSLQDYLNFRTEWMHRWYYYWQSESLIEAFEHARQNANWPPNGDQQLWNALRVYGYVDMRFDGFNHKGDWRWP